MINLEAKFSRKLLLIYFQGVILRGAFFGRLSMAFNNFFKISLLYQIFPSFQSFLAADVELMQANTKRLSKEAFPII